MAMQVDLFNSSNLCLGIGWDVMVMRKKLLLLSAAAAMAIMSEPPVEPDYYRSLPSRKRHSVFPRQKIDKRMRRK